MQAYFPKTLVNITVGLDNFWGFFQIYVVIEELNILSLIIIFATKFLHTFDQVP